MKNVTKKNPKRIPAKFYFMPAAAIAIDQRFDRFTSDRKMPKGLRRRIERRWLSIITWKPGYRDPFYKSFQKKLAS